MYSVDYGADYQFMINDLRVETQIGPERVYINSNWSLHHSKSNGLEQSQTQSSTHSQPIGTGMSAITFKLPDLDL